MTPQEFEKRVIALMDANPDPRNSATEDFLVALKNEVEAKSGGGWNNNVALDVMKQFEWVLEQTNNEQA